LIAARPAPSRTRARLRRPAKAAEEGIVKRARVRVDEPPHLCRVQSATRELCRMAGLNEGDVFSAVIAVTELAHRHFIEGARSGGVDLAIVRRGNSLSLVVKAIDAASGAPASARLNFSPEIYES
jgi:hypothetical protein